MIKNDLFQDLLLLGLIGWICSYNSYHLFSPMTCYVRRFTGKLVSCNTSTVFISRNFQFTGFW